MAGETDPTSPWWYVLGTLLAALGGAFLKTFVDLVGKRDSSAERWREDLMKDMARLREWNEKQQIELNSYQGRLDKMSEGIMTEQTMRHDLKNQLVTVQMEHEILKSEYKALLRENDELKIKVGTACATACHLSECPLASKKLS